MLQLHNVTLTGITDYDIYGLSVAQEICQKDIEFGGVKLFTSNKTTKYPNLVHIDTYFDYNEYRKFKIESLIDYIDTDYILHVEPDSFVLNTELWSDGFFEYDCIGPIFKWQDDFLYKYDWLEGITPPEYIMGGGFTLRSKKFCKCIQKINKKMEKQKTPFYGSDDLWVGIKIRSELEKMGCKFAPIDIARSFASEENCSDTTKSFGFHGSHANIDQWLYNNLDYYMNKKRKSIVKRT